LENLEPRGGEFHMAFRLKAVILITALSSLASFLGDWGWGP
jgi:hypothetical protein